MFQTMLKKLAKLGRRNIGTQPCPDIRWDEVVRILAIGTDAFGPFEISLFFFHSDGTEARLCIEHRGYDRILDSLPQRYPSISRTWYDEMAETSWDVERVLYEKAVA